jgi:hypothetical protein
VTEPRPRTVKVRVVLTVEVDVDDYALNYGTEDVATIRSDVRYAVVDAVNSGAVLHDGIINVELREDPR